MEVRVGGAAGAAAWGWRVCTLGALAVLAACGGGDDRQAQAAPSGGGPGGPDGGGPPPVNVELVAVERGTLARSVTVTGLSEPLVAVGVNAQLAGTLLAVNVEEGSVVQRGQVLARLDDRELRAQAASAEASLDVARRTLDRSEQLREAQVITAAEYDRDRAAQLAARAQLEQLQARLSYATIRAPIGGIVTEKRLERGDLVAPQTRLFTIADVSTMVVRVQVSELDVLHLGAGSTVQVALDALPGRAFEGRVRRVFPAADPETRLVPVEVALTGPAARMARPGFLARVTFALDERRDAVLVPPAAVVGASGSEAVFTVNEGRAVRRPIQTGLMTERHVEVRSGVDVGDSVVVLGNMNLRDGAPVRVVRGAGSLGERAGNGGDAPRGVTQ